MRTSLHVLSSFPTLCTVLCLTAAFPQSGRAEPLDQWHWRNPVPTANRLSAITFFDEKFVAVGDFGGVFVSEDGAAWNTSASGVRENLNTLTTGNGLLVAVGDHGVILTSTDGQTWTSRASATTNHLRGVAFGNSVFVAAGDR